MSTDKSQNLKCNQKFQFNIFNTRTKSKQLIRLHVTSYNLNLMTI